MDVQRTISAIAWDLDNTLFDRDGAVRRFFSAWLAQQQPAISERERAQALGRIAVLDCSGEGDRLQFCRSVLDALEITHISPTTLWDQFREHMPSFISPEPRTLALLAALSAEFPMCLVTNGAGRLQRAKATRCGLDSIFAPADILVSGEVGVEKPEPGIFALCLDRLGCSAEDVLFVGDHPIKDISGAAAVGMRTCWVSNDRSLPRGIEADLIVTSVTELTPSLLQAFPFRAAA